MQFTLKLNLSRELSLVSCISWPVKINQSLATRPANAAFRSSEKTLAHVREKKNKEKYPKPVKLMVNTVNQLIYASEIRSHFNIKWPARRSAKGAALCIIRILRVWVQFSMNTEKNMQTIALTISSTEKYIWYSLSNTKEFNSLFPDPYR